MIDVASLVPSIIGLGTKIGTAIPGLRKPKRPDTAGAIARTAGAQFGSAVGASQAGYGASRGLALRTGLRAGTEAVGRQSAAIGQAAATDEANYQKALQARNKNIAQFGTDLAKGLGDMAAIAIGPKSTAGEAGDAAGQVPEDMLPTGEVLPGQGVAEAPLPEDKSFTLDDLEQGQLDQQAVEQQQIIDEGQAGLEQLREARREVYPDAGPRAAFQVDPATQLIESKPPQVMPEIEQQLADKLHMKELMLAEAERLGLGLDTVLARVNRRLQLRPGQSVGNPFGVTLGGGTDGEGQ